MKIKLNYLTIINMIMFLCTLPMFIYVLYSMENYNIINKRKFTNIELNQLKFVERSELNKSIGFINENINQLYGMSYYITNSVPLLNFEDTSEYIALSTDQLDSIFNSCKNNAKKRYKEKYERAYSYYVRSEY